MVLLMYLSGGLTELLIWGIVFVVGVIVLIVIDQRKK
ncbi:hypothetical protein EVA_18043 [gut metagenome]|uniref:Uncharacterized protein n=1 Tax=gut metagenome TaxID=749906 RepID=J9G2Q5_9ZZZZ